MSLLSTAHIDQSDQDLSAFYKSSAGFCVEAERTSEPLKHKHKLHPSVYIPLPDADDNASQLTDEEIKVPFPVHCTFCQTESLFVDDLFNYELTFIYFLGQQLKRLGSVILSEHHFIRISDKCIMQHGKPIILAVANN